MSKNNSKEIKQRVPYGVSVVEDYDIDSATAAKKIEAMIDRSISQLQKQGVDISQCSDYLESIVDEEIARLESTLERKHRSNESFLSGIFLRRASDKKDFKELNARLKEEISKTEVEIDLVKRLYEKCNPLYKGALNLNGIKLNLGDEYIEESEDDDTDDTDE